MSFPWSCLHFPNNVTDVDPRTGAGLEYPVNSQGDMLIPGTIQSSQPVEELPTSKEPLGRPPEEENTSKYSQKHQARKND